MMKNNLITVVIAAIAMSISLANDCFAQKTEPLKDPSVLLEDASSKFYDKNYSTAYQLYQLYLEQYADLSSLKTQEAYYTKAVCAAKMYNDNADEELLFFINTFAENPLKYNASMELAAFYFQKNDFDNAIKTYSQIDETLLGKEEISELYYKKGYCYFQKKDFEKAKPEFIRVKDIRSKYSSPALYYYSHILYEEKHYDNALKGFNELRTDRNFGRIVPYYIAQIYYMQGKYEDLIQIAQGLLESSSSKRDAELGYMLGDSFFKLGKYKEAIPYFQHSVEKDTLFDVQTNYCLGYCLYKTSNYSEATKYLKKINTNDSLAQNAYYYLACSYLSIEDKALARDYFRQASTMNYDKALKDDALLLYAKLCYELPTPYNEAIDALQTYLSENKTGTKANEAKRMLAKIFASSKNYQEALDMLDQVANPDKDLLEVYQRVCLNRATELFNEQKDDQALLLLDKSLANPYSDEVTGATYYIKSEVLYRKGNFLEAEKNLNMFYSTPEVTKSAYYFKANYSMGYALFRQKKYSLAKDYFKRFLINTSKEDLTTIADAYNRYADCLFMEKKFNDAIVQYDNAINENSIDLDYSSYQKALALGASGKTGEKIGVLKDAISRFSKSNYAASMIFELGNSYIVLDDNQKALQYYEQLVSLYPNSIHKKAALGKIGMIYYKLNNDEKAFEALDSLVKNYSGTEEAKAGLLQIRAIYVEQNRVDDFFNYVKSIPQASISSDEKDSILYQAAENRYMESDCNSAIKGFEDYISRFPNGAFAVNANYYMADCLTKNGQMQDALIAYLAVSKKAKNKFTENSLLSSANIAYSLGQYQLAGEQYLLLGNQTEINAHAVLAKIGRARSLYKDNNYNPTITASQDVLELTKLPQDVKEEAIYMLAQSHKALGDTIQSLEYFQKLKSSDNGEYSAEANYTFAQNFFDKGEYDQSEKVIHSITANPSSEYWLAKTFILWGDIFYKKHNNMQAKQTYQSIIDNYDGEDLVSIAQQRLNAIIAAELQAQKVNQQGIETAKEEVDEIEIEK
jgi:TolA-binding protein